MSSVYNYAHQLSKLLPELMALQDQAKQEAFSTSNQMPSAISSPAAISPYNNNMDVLNVFQAMF